MVDGGEPALTAGRLWAWYLAAALAAVGVSAMLPTYGTAWTAIHLAVNATVIGAFARGIRRHRPDPRAPWLALAAGYAVYLAANAARYLGDPRKMLADDALAGGLYLAAYALTGAGLLAMARARGVGRDLAAFGDAFISVAALLILWHRFLAPARVLQPGATAEAIFVALAYPAPGVRSRPR